MNKNENLTVNQRRNKNLLSIGINLVLAAVSVFLFNFWFKEVASLESLLQKILNFSIVFLTFLTFFVAKTYYIKGVMNTGKKIITLVLLSASILGLMLLSVKTPSDIIYPFSGLLLSSIAFYMISLSAGTLNTVGMVALSLLFAVPIAFLQWFGKTDWSTTATLSKYAIFIILFFGGTWAQIRMAIHGIRGTNSDSGGFGDENDGDGDIGDE